jgi:hypothetical protein
LLHATRPFQAASRHFPHTITPARHRQALRNTNIGRNS